LFDTKSSATRKNPWAVLTAWRKAFPTPTPQARLTLKVNSLAADLTTDARLKQELEGRSDIRLLTDRFSDAEMTDFVASFDLLISLHRSEGFGLPLAEAMAAGVPVVATGWSGNLEFCDQKNAALVPYTLVPIRDPDGFYSGLKGDAQVWAEPDIDAAADLLGRLSTSSADRAVLARNARASVGSLLSRWQGEAIADLPFNAHLKSHASTRS
jgi:glycosyltransferase involved in cell wall biosynthesis